MGSVNMVMQSYGRCCSSSKLFDDFYEYFLGGSPVVREYFINTDLAAQKHLLRVGVMNLVLYARGMNDTKLRALGKSHSRAALNIKPELYELWLEAFLRAVKGYDAQATDEDILACREVLSKGVRVIKSFY